MQQSLLNHLDRQVRFLENSCWLYDMGRREEAVRIATIIRVLLHDTGASKSLLFQLQSKDIQLLDTCRQRPSDGTVFHGLGIHGLTGVGETLMPNFDLGTQPCFRPLSDWWDQVVCDTDPDTQTRKTIVLVAANKDGGAHADLAIPSGYARLAAPGFITKMADNEGFNQPIVDAHYVALRQMGYELLNSPQLISMASRADPLPYRVPGFPPMPQYFLRMHLGSH